jgi:hypothetical protein
MASWQHASGSEETQSRLARRARGTSAPVRRHCHHNRVPVRANRHDTAHGTLAVVARASSSRSVMTNCKGYTPHNAVRWTSDTHRLPCSRRPSCTSFANDRQAAARAPRWLRVCLLYLLLHRAINVVSILDARHRCGRGVGRALFGGCLPCRRCLAVSLPRRLVAVLDWFAPLFCAPRIKM